MRMEDARPSHRKVCPAPLQAPYSFREEMDVSKCPVFEKWDHAKKIKDDIIDSASVHNPIFLSLKPNVFE